MGLGVILAATVGALLLSVGAAGLVLLVPERSRRRAVPCLVAFATGTLLGAAFLGMIPSALRLADSERVLPTILAGIVLFFILEKIVLWRHCHDEECAAVHGRVAPLILIGDAFHNLVDGLVIGGAFFAGIDVGVMTSLAVIAHEIPQEIGDFAILLDSGYEPRRALLWNFISGVTVVAGGVIAWMLFGQVTSGVAYVLALAAASFIYVAAADLIPELHRKQDWRTSATQLALILAGIMVIVLVHAAASD